MTMYGVPQCSRGGLHSLLLATTSGRSEISNVNIIILLELFKTGQDSLLDELLAPRRRGGGFSRFLHLNQCLCFRQAAQSVNKNSIRFSNVETNVGNLIRHQSVQDRQDEGFNDIESDNGGKGLEKISALILSGKVSNLIELTEMAKHVVIR